MSNLERLLYKIDLSQREIDIYIYLCIYGPQAGSVAAKHVNMKRTTVYHLLKRLIEKGLVYSFKKGKTNFFAICPLDEAVAQIDRKKDELIEKKRCLENISNIVHNYVHDGGSIVSKIQCTEFHGQKEIEQLRISMLRDSSDFYLYSQLHNDSHFFGLNDSFFMKKYQSTILGNKKNIYILLPQNEKKSKISIKTPSSISIQVRFLPTEESTTQELDLAINTNQVAMIDKQFGFAINSKRFAQLHINTFMMLWEKGGSI